MKLKSERANEKVGPFSSVENILVLIKSQNKGQSMMNMVSLNIKILKEHILQQDLFGYWFLGNVVDMAMEELIARSAGRVIPVPMELISLFNIAEEKLKVRGRIGKAASKAYTRTYVNLWSKLYKYLCDAFDYHVAERMFVEAYNILSQKKYAQVLKVEYKNVQLIGPNGHFGV